MLNRYLERQLQPGDLVAIIRTAGGAGALQQFTTDRRLLKAAIERIRWSARVWPFTRTGPGTATARGWPIASSATSRSKARSAPWPTPCAASRRCQDARPWCSCRRDSPSPRPVHLMIDALPDVDQVIDSANRGGVVMYTDRSAGPCEPGRHGRRGDVHRRAVKVGRELHRHRCGHRGAGQLLGVEGAVRDAGVARIPRGADGRLRRGQPEQHHRRSRPHRGGHARLLPDRLRQRDPAACPGRQGRGQDPREAQGSPGAGTPGPLRPRRSGRAAPDAAGGPAALGRAVAVHDRHAGRAALRAVRA